MTEMLRANHRGYDPVVGEDVWTIKGLLEVHDSGKLQINDQGKLIVDVDWETAGETGRPVSVTLNTEVLLGNYANAIKGYVDCGTSGGSIGLLSSINAEMKLPNGTCRGAYYPMEIEWVGQTSTTFGAPGTGSQSGLFFIAAGGDVDELDDNGVFMNLNGLTPESGHLLSEDMHTLKCTIDNGTYAKYLLMSIAENYLSHYFTVIDDDDRIFQLRGLWDTPGNPDGEGIFNIAVQITGTTTGEANLCSAWINLETDAVITGWSHLHTDGFYDTSSTLAAGHLAWAKYAAMLNDDPLEHFIMDLNMVGVNSGVDAIYNVNNPELCLGYTGGAATGEVGSIPIFSTGGVKKYLMVYSLPA